MLSAALGESKREKGREGGRKRERGGEREREGKKRKKKKINLLVQFATSRFTENKLLL